MLNGIELDDPAKVHDFGFAKGFLSQEFVELIQ
jgi:hypothetical protein